MATEKSLFDVGVRLDGRKVTVVGAGIVGLWQAVTLGAAGAEVTLIERAAQPFTRGASRWAAAMIAPDCEGDAQPPALRSLGHEGLAAWRKAFADLIINGTLVVAHGRDLGELARFSRDTQGHETVHGSALQALEPSLAERFSRALFFADEAHIPASKACELLLKEARNVGVITRFETEWNGATGAADVVVDCRGYDGREAVKGLRGVRGERIVVEAKDVSLSRPVRLLHPRQPLYIVPQGGNAFVIGATVIESENDGPVTLRSALDLLAAAYSVDARFSEAAIIDMGAGLRPAFADNMARIIVDGGDCPLLRVNGVYRNGFMLAPVLAGAVARYIGDGTRHALFA